MAQSHELTMIELAAAIRAGELSPVAVTDHYLRRTTELNDQVGAFYTITPELAADQARAAEKAVAEADEVAALPPLTGVPIPIKDLNMVAGVRQTLGSKAFEANVPDADDNVVVYIKQAGAVITGKTATPEFGLPCYTETAVGPPARTPWDLTRSAGGSSGGAAAAVAAGPAACGSAGRCRTRSTGPRCTRTASRRTRRPAPCWPASGTRSRTSPCRSARTWCRSSRPSGTHTPRWPRSPPSRRRCSSR